MSQTAYKLHVSCEATAVQVQFTVVGSWDPFINSTERQKSSKENWCQILFTFTNWIPTVQIIVFHFEAQMQVGQDMCFLYYPCWGNLVRNEQNCGGGNFSCKQCIVLFSIVTGRSRMVYPFSYLLSVGLEILARALLGEFRERLAG